MEYRPNMKLLIKELKVVIVAVLKKYPNSKLYHVKHLMMFLKWLMDEEVMAIIPESNEQQVI